MDSTKQLAPSVGVRTGRAPNKNGFSILLHLLRSDAEEG